MMLEKYIPRFNLMKCIGILFLTFSTQTFCLDLFEKKYDVFSCDIDGKNCKKHPIQLSFKVDDKKGIVIMNMYEKGQFDSAKALEKCKVIDNKNWECTYSIKSPQGVNQWIYTMSDGRLSNDVPTTRFK